MNKIITFLLAYLTSIIIFAQDPLLKRIPSSSLFIASLKTENLLSKLNMEAIRNLEMIQDFKSQTKKSAKKDSTLVEQLFTDPSKHGLYFQPNCYLYLDYENTSNTTPSVGMIIPLKTGKKFEKMITSVIGKDKFSEKFEKKKKYSWTEDKEFAIAYTKKYLLIYNFEGKNSTLTLDEKIDYLINSDLEPISNNKNFLSFHEKQTDIYYWMSLGSLFESTFNASSSEDRKLLKHLDGFKDLELGYRINFNNGVLNYESETTLSNESIKNLSKVYGSGVPESMTKLVPQKDLYALISMSFNLEESEKLMKETLKELNETIEEEIANEVLDLHEFYDEFYDDLSEEITEIDSSSNSTIEESDSLNELKRSEKMAKLDSTMTEYGLKRSELWSLLNGNILMAVNNTKQIVDTFETYSYSENEDGDFGYYPTQKTRNIEIPLFKVIMDTKNPNKIKIALDSLTSKGILNLEKEGYYSFSITQFDYYAKVTNDNLILSNDITFISQFTEGYDKNARLSPEHTSNINSKPGYFYLDLQKTIGASKKSMEDNQQALMVFDELEKTFVDIRSTGEIKGNISTGNVDINLVNEQQNSLYSILNMINNLYVTFTKKK